MQKQIDKASIRKYINFQLLHDKNFSKKLLNWVLIPSLSDFSKLFEIGWLLIHGM